LSILIRKKIRNINMTKKILFVIIILPAGIEKKIILIVLWWITPVLKYHTIIFIIIY
jgi:hypothetical protein